MKTKLQLELAKIAPNISIRTHWERGPDCGPISKECDGFTRADDPHWKAWQSEVRATAIHEGEEYSGSAYLGATFERAEDHPAFSNPEISGYENQMTVEAMEDLAGCLPEDAPDLRAQIAAACAHCDLRAEESYQAQRADIEASRAQTATA